MFLKILLGKEKKAKLIQTLVGAERKLYFF